MNQRKMDEHSDVKMRELLLDARTILNMISLTVDPNQAKDRARYLCFHIFLHRILRTLVFLLSTLIMINLEYIRIVVIVGIYMHIICI